jgi:signal peptidase complex subunit 3|uniref:Signal peptidase complex subunit 3 n=1 Tax=Tetraselmis chuii TaxID=63592 RepID=A0A7S1SWI0_9CHLO|mmetsp:Transcript_33349/g.59697  ORF Transcript_33349/g.59697 Transcript_33349/m.59697 type:complete len:175 (+) Transcript_33349:287-811(+)
MHSLLVRANALLTFAGTTLTCMALLAMLTDCFHTSAPEVRVGIKSVERLYELPNGNEEAYIVMDLHADLRSVFSWNTKQLFVFVSVEYATPRNGVNQVVVFDKIVEEREAAVITSSNLRNKYNLVDQGKNLKGKTVNVTVTWNVMPVVGALYTRGMSSEARLPNRYVTGSNFRS